MSELKFVKLLAQFISISGLLVLAGWFFDIGLLKSLFPGLVEMKFTTALCFVASGIVLYSATEEDSENSLIVQTILPAAILLILLLMVTIFITVIFGMNVGLDNFFIQEKFGAIDTFIPGRPSVPTMISFILISISGILVLIERKKLLIWLGILLVPIGVVATLGYIFHQPFMYYLIVGKNTAMALNTAILMILIGIGFILCGKIASKQN